MGNELEPADRQSETAAERTVLLIDADDTLWENNIYFLDVTERFLDEVSAQRVEREGAQDHLSEIQRANISRHGYGSRSFAISIEQAYVELVPEADEQTVARLRTLAHGIAERDEIEILPGVGEALAHLAGTHRLILLTKGDKEEQERKVERSGLGRFFERVEVVAEKNEETYRALISDLGIDPKRAWMIGNSPRSDINPALAAGLNAVLIPHPQTWEMELEEVVESPRLVVADRLGDVIALFTPQEGA